MIKNEKKTILKSQYSGYEVKFANQTNFKKNEIQIRSVQYSDSAYELFAYVIIDDDTTNKIYIDPIKGVEISKPFETLKIQIKNNFQTRSMKWQDLKGKSGLIVLTEHELVSNLFFDGEYFLLNANRGIDFFNSSGNLRFTMEPF